MRHQDHTHSFKKKHTHVNTFQICLLDRNGVVASISSFIYSLPTAVFQQADPVSNTEDDSNFSATMNDTNLPVTGICLVAKPTNVPTGYQCIRKAHDDQNRDADLMADSLLERKDRFVCITRAYPLADNRTLVLEDIKLINERDTPPPQYIALSQTVDSREKGTVKRTICVKMVDRQAGMKCVCDIIFLYRSKRPPQFYTLIGDINGLQMCIREGNVPPLRQPPAPPTSSGLYPNTDGTGGHYQYQTQQSDHVNSGTLARKGEEKEALDGIPFAINPKYVAAMANGRNGANDLSGLDSFCILSSRDIEQKFRYDFTLERASY